jgi:hypothetical protein
MNAKRPKKEQIERQTMKVIKKCERKDEDEKRYEAEVKLIKK